MRTVLRHIGDGIEWAGLDEESPWTGKRRAGANFQITLRIYLPVVRSDYGMENVP